MPLVSVGYQAFHGSLAADVTGDRGPADLRGNTARRIAVDVGDHHMRRTA